MNGNGKLEGINAQWPMLGVASKYHKTTRRAPMSFGDKPYLIELYADFPNLEGADIKKCVQIGVSELNIIMALYTAGWLGRISAYVLPTFTIRDRFVQTRVNKLLQNVPAYRDLTMQSSEVEGKDKKVRTGNLKLKEFGEGSLLFLGSNTVNDFIEFSCDLLIIDEYDQCDKTNIAKARDRLRASPTPQFFRVGNPTLPRVGISKLYEDGDGRRWNVKCTRCNTYQPIDWYENVVEKTDSGAWTLRDKAALTDMSRDVMPVCTSCHRVFERSGRLAQWVPERSGGRRSYWITQLDVLSRPVRDFWTEFQECQASSTMLGAWHVGVLGTAYEQSGMCITNEMLDDVCTGPKLDHTGGDAYEKLTVSMGVDVGSVLNYVISVSDPPKEEGDPPTRRCVTMGAATMFDELLELARRYHVDVICIDAYPEVRKAQELRDHFRYHGNGDTVVWLCQFHPSPKVGAQSYGWRLDYKMAKVTVDRTQVFDQTFHDIAEGYRTFPTDAPSVLGWVPQMKASVRVLDEVKGRISWHEGNTPDHYRLAGIYDRIAYDLIQHGGSYFAV